MKRSRNKIIFIFGAAIVILLVLLTSRLFKTDKTAAGIAYLQSLEDKDLSALETQIQEQKNETMKTKIEEGQAEVFPWFADAVFIGDSRFIPWVNYVDSSRVLAGNGNTILQIDSYLGAIEEIQPAKIIVEFGINDLYYDARWDDDDGSDVYMERFEVQMDKMLAAAPNAQLYINDMLAVQPSILTKYPMWEEINNNYYNDQIQALCKKRGWVYIDNSSLDLDGYADIYQDDGYHFVSSFYPEWAKNIYLTSLN
jgi:lysophospholipase L1-like esterase